MFGVNDIWCVLSALERMLQFHVHLVFNTTSASNYQMLYSLSPLVFFLMVKLEVLALEANIRLSHGADIWVYFSVYHSASSSVLFSVSIHVIGGTSTFPNYNQNCNLRFKSEDGLDVKSWGIHFPELLKFPKYVWNICSLEPKDQRLLQNWIHI